MDVELEPEQPRAVVEVVEELLEARGANPSAWWRAGIEEANELLSE